MSKTKSTAKTHGTGDCVTRRKGEQSHADTFRRKQAENLATERARVAGCNAT